MEDDYFRNIRDGNWGYESETSSFTHSDIRHPWEDEVNSQGELYYVAHYPFSKDNSEQNQENSAVSDNNDKNNTGILGRLIRRRSSCRSIRKKDEKGNVKAQPDMSVPSDDLTKPSTSRKNVERDEDFESINIYMKIDFSNMKIIGRRATAVETFLGLKVTYEGKKIIINDVISNSPAHFNQSAFKKGDCLNSINGIIMTPENIENYLRNISFSKEVKEVVLTVQRLKPPPVVKNEPSTSSAFEEQEISGLEGFGVLFLRLGRSSDGTSSEEVVFSHPYNGNVISSVKGTFLTLLHLLPTLASNQPLSTTIKVNDEFINVMYTKKDDGIMLLAMPNSSISLDELYWVNTDIVRCLLFKFQTLTRCFCNERNSNYLHTYFHSVFKRIQSRQVVNAETSYEFESLLPAASSLPLSRDIYIQIDDALNELESNDVEAYEDQRLYSIVGSCYFFKGYNICSHLSKDDLVDIVSMCRQSDIFGFMRKGVSELVFWKEVFPASMNRGLSCNIHAPYNLLPASWYLLIVAKDHHFLFILMESGGYTLRPLQKSGPDVLYVEEALETLKHIIKIGISNIANKLIKENDESINKSFLSYSSSSNEQSLLSSSLSETTLNKQHSLSYRSLDGIHLARSRSNINVLASGYDSLSSDDCAPVIGRRAERELAMETLSRASDVSDDSDWNKEFKTTSKGVSPDTQDVEFTLPSKITAGDKDIMLHYVYLDKASGILISSANNSEDYCSLLNNFRYHAHKIHKIFMNTISFKKLKAQEVSSSTINKSMIAIKEHGILFESNDKKHVTHSYWVVGRIFFTPHLKEVYLCYQDSCPQNMIEVAFRLAMSCSL